jgi:hypothetical protein
MGTQPLEAARCREVFDLLAKSGLARRVGCRRMRRATRTGSASWIARRRRVEGSILFVLLGVGWGGEGGFEGLLTSWDHGRAEV